MEINKEVRILEKKLDKLSTKGVSFERNAILDAKNMELMNHSSFAIKFVALLGGIIGSFTLLGAIYALDLSVNYVFNLVCTLLFWGAAFWVHTKRKQIVYDTILICLVLMASYFSYTVLDDLDYNSTLNNSFLVIAIGVVCMAFFKNELLSFLGSLGVLIGLFAIATELDLVWGTSLYLILLITSITFLFLKESVVLLKSSKIREAYKSIRLAHILVVLGVLNFSSSSNYFGVSFQLNYLVIICLFTCLIWNVFRIIKEQQHLNKRDIIIIAVVGLLMVLPTYMSLGFGFSVLLLLLCFRAQYKTGLILAIFSFCYFLFMFYYDLAFTLMVKSLLLMGTGLILLGLYILVTRKNSTDEL